MVTQKIICDRCKAEVNGGGYCISHESAAGGIAIEIAQNTRRGYLLSHFCGKQCLMLALNEMVDRIGTFDTDTDTCTEECYENHIAA